MSMTTTEKTSLILNAENKISLIESAIKQIEKNAVKAYKNRLADSNNFISVDDVDVLTEQYDSAGFRRYALKNSEGGAVMVPEKNGFWTPRIDIKD